MLFTKSREIRNSRRAKGEEGEWERKRRKSEQKLERHKLRITEVTITVRASSWGILIRKRELIHTPSRRRRQKATCSPSFQSIHHRRISCSFPGSNVYTYIYRERDVHACTRKTDTDPLRKVRNRLLLLSAFGRLLVDLHRHCFDRLVLDPRSTREQGIVMATHLLQPIQTTTTYSYSYSRSEKSIWVAVIRFESISQSFAGSSRCDQLFNIPSAKRASRLFSFDG